MATFLRALSTIRLLKLRDSTWRLSTLLPKQRMKPLQARNLNLKEIWKRSKLQLLPRHQLQPPLRLSTPRSKETKVFLYSLLKTSVTLSKFSDHKMFCQPLTKLQGTSSILLESTTELALWCSLPRRPSKSQRSSSFVTNAKLQLSLRAGTQGWSAGLFLFTTRWF